MPELLDKNITLLSDQNHASKTQRDVCEMLVKCLLMCLNISLALWFLLLGGGSWQKILCLLDL